MYQSFINIKRIFQVAGIAFGEILFITFHLIAVNCPHFVFIGLVSEVTVELLFDQL